jgi:hypothetical protein
VDENFIWLEISFGWKFHLVENFIWLKINVIEIHLVEYNENISSYQYPLLLKKYMRRSTLKNQEYKRGRYHLTIDLLFDWFGLVCFANKNKNC